MVIRKEYLQTGMLKVLICGSVDDGKSTLIGRLIYDSASMFSDQLERLKVDSQKFGTQGDSLDFALLVDGLSSEREQGITIDVAHRYFNTKNRSFIILDSPGHIEYTRNMVTAASNANVAVLLIDANIGLVEQTYRHKKICDFLGIKDFILVINKMDEVEYSQRAFEKIKEQYNSTNLSNLNEVFVPISALNGENVCSKSELMKWYKGDCLLSYLETLDISHYTPHTFVFPVQYVNRASSKFRGFCGEVLNKPIKKGDDIKIWPNNKLSKIKSIWLGDVELDLANPGLNVALEIEDNVSINRGSVLAEPNAKINYEDLFEADIIWLDNKPGIIGRSYLVKIGFKTVNATITNLKYKSEIDTGKKLAASIISQNDIARVQFSTLERVCSINYSEVKELGSFLIIDRETNQTLGAGMIRFPLRRSGNIIRQSMDVTRQLRETLNGHKAHVYWFTGLSGSGKTTIANAFAKELHVRKVSTYVLDGDNIRHGLNRDLGFKVQDRVENIRRISEVAKLMVDAGLVVIVTCISPIASDRTSARSMFEPDEFSEVYMSTSLSTCEKRDPKGLYRKARNGDIKNFTGIDSPYEIPKNPNITITEEVTLNDAVEKLLVNFENAQGSKI